MRTPAKVRVCVLLACLPIFLLVLSRAAATGSESDIAIVVNSKNPANNLTLSELRRIFLGEKQYWSANSPVVLLMRSQGTREREVILRVVFQMTEEQYTKYWVAKAMRAEASDPPAALFSHGMVQEGVKGNPGAIGYASMNDVRPGVKVVRIDGLLPGDSGYPLH